MTDLLNHKFDLLSEESGINQKDFYTWCFILSHAASIKGFDWVYRQILIIRGKADEQITK